MIKFENRFDEYAYRVASLPLAKNVERVEEGQWVTVKNNELVLATGAEAKAFLCIGSKREGRDQVAGKFLQKVSFLVGTFVLSVNNFDTAKTYGPNMTDLAVNADGNLTPATEGSKVVAVAFGAPVGGYLRIVNK